jgi:hypothetical protein
MRIPRFRAIAGLISGPAIIAGALVASAPASASPLLTPAPPSYVTCKTVGNGSICDGTLTFTYAAGDTGIACGSGAGAFDIFDGPGTVNLRSILYYNTDGNLTKGVDYIAARSAYSNPLTWATVPYIQHQTSTNVLAVPGDVTSRTSTITGQNNFTVPGMGAVALQAGRVVTINSDSTIVFSAGPDWVFDLFFEGDTAAVAELCTALGAS